MTTEKPLPCPFDGADPVVMHEGCTVFCPTPSCPVAVLRGVDAVRRWNTRAGSTR